MRRNCRENSLGDCGDCVLAQVSREADRSADRAARPRLFLPGAQPVTCRTSPTTPSADRRTRATKAILEDEEEGRRKDQNKRVEDRVAQDPKAKEELVLRDIVSRSDRIAWDTKRRGDKYTLGDTQDDDQDVG